MESQCLSVSRKGAVALLVVAALLAGGCAKSGSMKPKDDGVATPNPLLADQTPVDETLSIHSTPPGALAKLSTGETCRTPCAVKKRNIDSFDVRLSKDGYNAQTVEVSSIARAVPGSGANGIPTLERPRLVPNPISVTLVPEWKKR